MNVLHINKVKSTRCSVPSGRILFYFAQATLRSNGQKILCHFCLRMICLIEMLPVHNKIKCVRWELDSAPTLPHTAYVAIQFYICSIRLMETPIIRILFLLFLFLRTEEGLATHRDGNQATVRLFSHSPLQLVNVNSSSVLV